MTSLILALLAADPSGPTPPVPEPDPAEVAPGSAAVGPAESPARVAPPIPPADVPDEVTKAADESMGYLLLRTFVVLGMVVMIAWLSLNWGLRRMLGLKAPSMGGSVVSVMERVPLDQRHALFVVKAAGEYLLVGGSEGSLALITKLDAAEVEKLKSERPPPLTLSPLLQKLLARKGTK